MAFVYCMDISNISMENVLSNWNYLDENRKNKIRSLHDENEKKLSFGAGVLIAWILNKHNISLNRLKFSASNKPIINDWFHISIAHSGKYACVAVANHPIGVDIQEDIGYLKHIEELYFSKEDKIKINSNTQKFYEVWCQKECYIKLFGYKNLKEIPAHIDYYYYHDFYLDSHYGCVLTEDKDFLVINKEFKEVISELKKQGGEGDGQDYNK